MSARWSLRVSLGCSLACYPLVLRGQEKSLPQQIADEMVLLAGGIHTGYRFKADFGNNAFVFVDAKGTKRPGRSVAPNNVEVQRSLAFNPIYITGGIELSDDPLVPLRSSVYALSVAHPH